MGFFRFDFVRIGAFAPTRQRRPCVLNVLLLTKLGTTGLDGWVRPLLVREFSGSLARPLSEHLGTDAVGVRDPCSTASRVDSAQVARGALVGPAGEARQRADAARGGDPLLRPQLPPGHAGAGAPKRS